MSDAVVWRGMTRDQLTAAYDNRAAVADSATRVADWTARSARLRAQHPAHLDLAYGPRPRNRIDLFRCGAENTPLFAFIHGGYWQRYSKEVFACMAEGPLARGFDVAMIGYTLGPEATLTEIVAETHAAIRWLRAQGPQHGVAKGKLVVSGWSAGGHLTAMAMSLPEVDAGLAISGIYDVEPIRLNALNDALDLTAAEAEAMSPIKHLPQRAGPLVVACGGNELPELRRQGDEYATAWAGAGLAVRKPPLKGHNHFSILDELAAPNGKLTAALVQLV